MSKIIKLLVLAIATFTLSGCGEGVVKYIQESQARMEKQRQNDIKREKQLYTANKFSVGQTLGFDRHSSAIYVICKRQDVISRVAKNMNSSSVKYTLERELKNGNCNAIDMAYNNATFQKGYEVANYQVTAVLKDNMYEVRKSSSHPVEFAVALMPYSRAYSYVNAVLNKRISSFNKSSRSNSHHANRNDDSRARFQPGQYLNFDQSYEAIFVVCRSRSKLERLNRAQNMQNPMNIANLYETMFKQGCYAFNNETAQKHSNYRKHQVVAVLNGKRQTYKVRVGNKHYNVYAMQVKRRKLTYKVLKRFLAQRG